MSELLFTSPLEEEKMWNLLTSQIVGQASKYGYFIPGEQSQKPVFKKEGRLVIVGSGIRSAAQFTTETISHIKNADKVLFFGSDPVTETYIRDLFPGALDLGVFFDGTKDRYDSCVQMAEACLFFARQGLYTVAIFPGHPGIFTIPSLRAIQIARNQGITADILPGISHEDSLFSDLAIDPYYHGGSQILGATDYLLFNRQLLTDAHVVLRHVGSIGEHGFSTRGVGMTNLPVLIKQLQQVYGPDYETVHYYPSQYATSKPFIERKPLSEFLKTEMLKTFMPFSTLYLPPMKTTSINSAMAVQLGLVSSQSSIPQLQLPTKFLGMYGPREKQAISSLAGFKFPTSYRPTICSAASRFLIDISTNPKKLAKYLKNPTKLMTKYAISPTEMSYLTSYLPQNVLLAVKPHSSTVALAVMRRLCTDPSFAAAYGTAASSFYSSINGEEKLITWLKLRGYETTPEAVDEKIKEIRRICYMMWVGNYVTSIPDVTVSIRLPKVSFAGVPLETFKFKDGVLSWMAGGGVIYNGILRFLEGPVNAFVGKVWKMSEVEPSVDNIRGEFVPSFEGVWKDLECVMGVGIAANLRVRSLLKFWRAHSQISMGPQLQISSQLPGMMEELEKTTVHLGSFETLLTKVNPDYKSIVLSDSDLESIGWPSMVNPAIGGSIGVNSMLIPHVSTVLV